MEDAHNTIAILKTADVVSEKITDFDLIFKDALQQRKAVASNPYYNLFRSQDKLFTD